MAVREELMPPICVCSDVALMKLQKPWHHSLTNGMQNQNPHNFCAYEFVSSRLQIISDRLFIYVFSLATS